MLRGKVYRRLEYLFLQPLVLVDVDNVMSLAKNKSI